MRRIRIVSFRMTEEEYECFRQHSFRYGATSVSEFARLLAGTVSGHEIHPEGGIATMLNGLKYQIEVIDTRLNTLSSAVERLQKLTASSGVQTADGPKGWNGDRVTLPPDAESRGA
jgi:hypothetical protein